MSDLFHEEVPPEFIQSVFEVMRRASWHTFQVLTKRSQRLLELSKKIDWPFNVWLGASVEDADYQYRLDQLFQVPAVRYFVSVEPMLGPVYLAGHLGVALSMKKPLWVICGCESGPKARPMEPDWVRSLRDDCITAWSPFFLKQAMVNGRLVKMPELDGKVWN